MHKSNEESFVVQKPWSRAVIMLILLASCFLAIGAWYYYEYHYVPAKEIPLLLADSGPIKMKPERAGGALVPYMDKAVYDTFKPGGDNARAVSMMPEPEQPIEITHGASKDAIEDIMDKILSENEIVPEKVAVTLQPPETAEVVPKENPKALQVIPVEPKDQPKTNKGSKPQKTKAFYRMQLASLRTHDAATKEYDRLRRMHAKVLGESSAIIQKINMDGHGVFYRLLVGKFKSFGAAKSSCKKLVSAQQSCIVVKY